MANEDQPDAATTPDEASPTKPTKVPPATPVASPDLPEGVSQHVVQINEDGVGKVDVPVFKKAVTAITDDQDRPLASSLTTPAPGITTFTLAGYPPNTDVTIRITVDPLAH